MGERAHAVAWKAALDAELAPAVRSYDYDESAKFVGTTTEPRKYVQITVARRYEAQPRMCGGMWLYSWRLTTRAVGTTVDETRWVRERVSRLEMRRLDAIGATRLVQESDDAPAPDGDRYSALTTWTYEAPNN